VLRYLERRIHRDAVLFSAAGETDMKE